MGPAWWLLLCLNAATAVFGRCRSGGGRSTHLVPGDGCGVTRPIVYRSCPEGKALKECLADADECTAFHAEEEPASTSIVPSSSCDCADCPPRNKVLVDAAETGSSPPATISTSISPPADFLVFDMMAGAIEAFYRGNNSVRRVDEVKQISELDAVCDIEFFKDP